MSMGMQQWVSELLDDGFVAVKKLKDKQGWLTKRGVTAVTRGNIKRVDDIFRGDRLVKQMKCVAFSPSVKAV